VLIKKWGPKTVKLLNAATAHNPDDWGVVTIEIESTAPMVMWRFSHRENGCPGVSTIDDAMVEKVRKAWKGK